MTGAYSVHTIYEGHEIMFHVSTLLPYSKDNKQQVRSTLGMLVISHPSTTTMSLWL